MTQSGGFKGFRKSVINCGNASMIKSSGLTQISRVKGATGYLGTPMPFNFNSPFIRHGGQELVSTPFQNILTATASMQDKSEI